MADSDFVRGPVGIRFQSFEEANRYYMDYNFHGWQEKTQTYAIPPVYRIHSKEAPHEKASNFIPFRKDVEASDLRGQLAEEEILRVFVEYGYHTAQPMFVFHSFDFKDLDVYGRSRLKLQMNMSLIQKETDLIVIHRDFGIILVETKSVKKFASKTYSRAKEELDRAEAQLFANPYFELPPGAKIFLKKVIACPFLQGKTVQSCKVGCEFIDLRQNHLSNFGEWWDAMIQTRHATKDHTTLCHDIYYNLVPKLLCGRGDICVCLNLSKTAAQLDSQASLEDLALRQSEFCKEKVKVCSTSEAAADTAILQKKWLYLTPEQCEVWRRDKQVICGPYGCGKTLLLQCKAAILACNGQPVLVVVPHHLVAGYKKFFEDNVPPERSNLKLVSKEEFCKCFDHYKMLAQSSHVFVDELLWPYWEGTDSSVGGSSTSEFSLEGLYNLEGEISGDLATEPTLSQNSSSTSETNVEGLHNLEGGMSTEPTLSQNNSSTSETNVEGLHNLEEGMSTEPTLSQNSSSTSETNVEGLHNLEEGMSTEPTLSQNSSSTSETNVEGLHNLEGGMSTEPTSSQNSSSTSETNVEGLHNLEEGMSTEPTLSQNSSSTSETNVEGLHNLEGGMSGDLTTEPMLSQNSSKSECSLEGLCNIEQSMSNSPETTDSNDLGVQLVNYLLSLFKAVNRPHCLWVVPHLYSIVRQKLFYDEMHEGEIYPFIANFEQLPVSSLNTTMRTSKQIHDFKIKNEWQEFCNACCDDEESVDLFLDHKVFQTVFCSFLGHSVSGPPVKTITYPSHCQNYGVQDKHPNQKIVDHFHHFSAKVIRAEIDQLLLQPPAIELIRKDVFESSKIQGTKSTLEPRDIAIIGDSSESHLNLELIKELLQDAKFTICSVKEFQEGKNSIAICYSCDIASLEWPVVIHIQAEPNQRLHYPKGGESPGVVVQFHFFHDDHSVISSRCMVYYIRICQQDDDTKKHGYSFTYDLDTEHGSVHNLETLYAKKVRPQLSAFDKIYGTDNVSLT